MSYLDSKRIVGTNAHRIGADAILGGWKEVGRTTLEDAATNITVSSLPDKRYYKVLTSITGQASNSDLGLRLNSDTGSNYARRFSTNGGSDISGTVTSLPWHYTDSSQTTPIFAMGYLANLSSAEKLTISHGVRQTGTTAGAPSRFESVGKWANTSNAINEIQVLATGGTNLNSGSEIVVLGYDPDDTHTDNFWEELADINATGSGSSFNTGVFTAKKYLWIQCWYKATGGGLNVGLQVGNNTISGSNYASRSNQNGSSDGTNTSTNNIVLDSATTDSGETGFANIFVINNASNEKLFIVSQTSVVATGAGTAPNRRETVGKWADTSNQINIVGLYDAGTGGNFTTSSFIKVWGSN